MGMYDSIAPYTDDEKLKFYAPRIIGTVSVAGKASCFGWSQDSSGDLVAASIQGSSTAVTSILANIAMAKNKTYLRRADNERNEIGANTDGEYRIFRRAIPDSNYLSAIIMSEFFFEDAVNPKKIYIPAEGTREDLLDRFYFWLKKITIIPVHRDWCAWLLDEGKFEYDPETRNRMCVPMHNDESININYAQTMGFRIWFMSSNRQKWESMIQRGLQLKKIGIHGENRTWFKG